jgi:hypothetical protein
MKLSQRADFRLGDLVTVRGMKSDEQFCILQLKKDADGATTAVLKALFADTYIIEKPLASLSSLLIKGKL